MKTFFKIFIGFLMLLLSIGAALANTIIMNETFESNSVANWTAGTGTVAIESSSPIHSGSYSLQSRMQLNDNNYWNADTFDYPNNNLSINAWVYQEDANKRNWFALWEDDSNYIAFVTTTGGTYTAGIYEKDGSPSFIDTSPVYSGGTGWYFWNITVSRYGANNEFVGRLYNSGMTLLATVQANSTLGFLDAPNSLTIGTSNGLGSLTDYWYDNIEVIQIETPPPTAVNFTVKAKNRFSVYINNFTAIVNGSSYSTTTGTVTTEILEDSGSVTVVVNDAKDSNGFYFNKTVSSIDTVTNYEMSELYQAAVKIKTFEMVTNNSIFSPLRLDKPGHSIQTFDTDTTFRLTAEEWMILAYNDSYFNKTINFTVPALFNGTFNVPDLYTTVLNISAVNAFTNTSIYNFTGNYTFTSTGWSSSYNTTPALDTAIFLIPGDWSIYAEAPGYAIHNAYNIYNTTITSETSEAYTFQLYTNNSILFNIFDAATLNYISENINISLIKGNTTYSENTSNGILFIDDLLDGTYTASFASSSYVFTQFFITVLNNSFQLQNVYLVSTASPVTFFVQNDLGENIDGAIATMTLTINGTPVVVGQETTDFAGIFQFDLDPNLWYSIILTHSDYETWTGDVKPTQTEYTINMENLGGTSFVSIYEDIQYSTTMAHPFNSSYAEFYLEIFSNIGSLQYYGLSYNSTVLSNQTGSTGGGTEFINVTAALPLEDGLTITYWFKSTNQTTLTTWDQVWLVSGVIPTNISLTNGLFDGTETADPGTQILLGMGIIMVLILLGGLLTASLMGASIAGMTGLGVAAYAGFLPLPISIVALVILSTMLIADALGGAK